MHARATTFALVASVLFTACGGGGGSSPSTPTGPSSTSSGGSTQTIVTISIMGDRGALSFSPNPATVPAGQTVVWRNADSAVHRVVIEGLVNTGDLAPGQSSAPQALGAVEKGYHCLIHPGMVGSLNNAPTPDACEDYGYGCR